MSPNKEDMWGVYLQPFLPLKEEPVSTFPPCRRWKASSRSSCHISRFFSFFFFFLAALTSGVSRWGVYVKDFFPSPISLFHSSASARLLLLLLRHHPPLLSSSASVPPSHHLSLTHPSALPSPPPCTLQFSFCLPQDVSKPASSSHSLHQCFYFPLK